LSALHREPFLRVPFADNPIGVLFDPDVLVERFRNGDAVEESIR